MNWTQIKQVLKRVWHFLWKEDSLLSWVANIVIAFIIIKFIIYPGLGWAFGTNLPVVAVVSESMEHNGNFNKWWLSPAECGEGIVRQQCTQEEWYGEKGISKAMFLNYSLHNGFNKGDIIILRGATYDNIHVGDIIVFQSKYPYPIIHRVVHKDDVLATKGDHNPRQLVDSNINEKYITNDQVIGKAWIKIPWLGYIKIWFSELISCITFNGCKFG